MDQGKLIVISRSGGKFTFSDDGSLSYCVITVSNYKDLQHLLDLHGNSETVDIYVLTNENQTSDQLSTSHSRSGMVDEPVTPTSISHAASISGDTKQLDSLASLTRDMDNPNKFYS
ncbi:uncharacterized protein LOC120131526 [Hibiscus syriacus]|uniref:uncharacterized protein LOC120131526 n=1 Tax=Hibiscus syriacus TaxID=106335 RepID=UPI00192186AE|nr:uncharacterized protein LOC120131526 [Hibiscus syriacus]